MATSSEAQQQPIVLRESVATKIARFLGRTPVYLLLAFLGVLWLVPTIGLFLTSVLDSGTHWLRRPILPNMVVVD